ncbi:unnamed protein product, partial [Laminaria digitata]
EEQETAGKQQDKVDYFAVTESSATGRPTRKAAAIANYKLRKRKHDGSSSDRAANAGNDRRQKRASSSRNIGEGTLNHDDDDDDDQQLEQSGAGHKETDVAGQEGDRVGATAAAGDAPTAPGSAKDSDDTVRGEKSAPTAAALPLASAAPVGTESAHAGGSVATAE